MQFITSEYFIGGLFLVILFALELIYFRLATLYRIIDKPNQRSSHKKLTIRGGGVIFPIAVLLWWPFYGFQFPWLIAGLILISTVSFIDDIRHLHSKVRFLVQAIAFSLIFFNVTAELAWYYYFIVLILGIATINAWNFMDGINGIMGIYSLVTVGTLYFINSEIHTFSDDQLLLALIMALLVFNYFNFRRSAKCFAGDVGSISMAFVISFFLLRVISESGNLMFLSLILLYGLDTLTTIFFRLIRRENIFEAHRLHFYQFLVNEQRVPHIVVAAFYGAVQLMINIVVLSQFEDQIDISRSAIELVLLFIVSLTVFVAIRFYLEGYSRLTGREVREIN